jgi:thymidylate kinase
MQKKARYVVFEGTDGVGKSTNVEKLSTYLRNKGFKVLTTKEPGTPLAPATMELRGLMLNAKYANDINPEARELISQAIRSIHINKVIVPALSEYDFIIQDRGILSGLAYGSACGNNSDWLRQMSNKICVDALNLPFYKLYDDVVYLKGDTRRALAAAKNAKQEYAEGDVIENQGNALMEQVAYFMNGFSYVFGAKDVNVDNKSIDEVFAEILEVLKIS